jgi:hypothetical protein
MEISVHIPEQAKFSSEQVGRLLSDPVLFIHNCVYTYDPRPEAFPNHLPFKLYPFQVSAVRSVYHAIINGYDIGIEKSRDMGMSWLVASVLVYCWLTMPTFTALVGSRNEDSVDNGTMDSIFAKLEYIIERLPFKPAGYERDKHRNYMRIINPANGNAISGEASSLNFGRRGRYTCVLLDEGAFWPYIRESWAACGDSTPCRIFVTTPPRRENYATHLRFKSSMKWLSYPWSMHPKKTIEWYNEQKERRKDDPVAFAQEIDIDWEGSLSDLVYPTAKNVPTRPLSFNREWPLYIAMDPGHRPDPFSVVVLQKNMDTEEIFLIDGIEVTSRETAWFYPMFTGFFDDRFVYSQAEREFMVRVSTWVRLVQDFYAYGDPAGNHAEGTSGFSVYDLFASHCKVTVQYDTKAVSHQRREDATVRYLSRLVVNDSPGAQHALNCLQKSSFPEKNENGRAVDSEKERKPVHDWKSHARSALEYFFVNFNDPKNRDQFDWRSFEGDHKVYVNPNSL